MRKKVEELLDEALQENDSLFLIDFTISEANHIRIIIDGDNGVTVEDCMLVSRAIEHNLDREEVDFSLEVMSAGVSEGLKLPRQYSKNVGRDISVKTTSSEKIEGTLVEVNDDSIKLTWKAREPKPVGKGKVTVEKEAVLKYDEIAEAKVIITFN